MGEKLKDVLNKWPKYFIKDSDLRLLLVMSNNARYSTVKRAVKSGLLIRIKRGLYIISGKIKNSLVDEFELALLLYGPSFVSLELALAYKGWIPESVFATTSVCTRRSKEFVTPFGLFSYRHIPAENFYLGVDRIEIDTGFVFIATPWRAIADLIYTRRKSWSCLARIEADLRIDIEELF